MCWRNTSSVISFKYKSPRSFHAATIGSFRHRTHHLSSLWPMQMHPVFPKHCGDSWNFKHRVWQSGNCLMLMSFDSRATPSEYWCEVADVWRFSGFHQRCVPEKIHPSPFEATPPILSFSTGFNTNLAVSPLTQFLKSIWYWIAASVHAALANLYPHQMRTGPGPGEKTCCFTTSKHRQHVQTIWQESKQQEL